jgi:hypothetical protein
MTFEEAHHLFIKKHLKARKGESLRRLKEGHDHAERLFFGARMVAGLWEFQ